MMQESNRWTVTKLQITAVVAFVWGLDGRVLASSGSWRIETGECRDWDFATG